MENVTGTILDVRHLKKSFGDHEVLKDINMTVKKGDVIAIIGPSGCGKSTFLRCLNCMEDPTGGEIFFRGENLVDMKVDINEHRQHIGMVFQQFNLFNNKTVLQNVMLAPVHIQCTKYRKTKLKNFFIKLIHLLQQLITFCYSLTTTVILKLQLQVQVQ